MRLVGLISILVGLGVMIQYLLGLGISFGGLYFLRDLHASIGILGLILVMYLFYSSIRSQGLLALKVSSLLTLLITLTQVALGIHIYFSPSIYAANIHLILGAILIISIAVTGYISMRASKIKKG